MAIENEEILNPGTPGDGSVVDDGAANQDQDFLVVDERTKYRTSEDAIRGFSEAGRRIAELTPWQQVASEYGLRDPNDIAQFLDELIELRASKGSASPKGGDAVAAPAAGNEPQPSKEQAAALEWLKANGVKAGLISSAELQKVQESLDELKQFREQAEGFQQAQEDQVFRRHIDEANSSLKGQLSDLGIKFTDKNLETQTMSFLTKALTAWVNEDGSRIERFHAGDIPSLIKEGLASNQLVLNVFKNQPAANYAASKQATTRQSARPAPKAPVRHVEASTETKKKNAKDTGEDFTSDVHNKAWEVMQAAVSRQ